MSDVVFTDKQNEAMDAIASEQFALILFGGAMAGGKTFWGLSALLIMCQVFPKSRWCVIREDMEKLRTTTIPSFKKLNASGRLKESPYEYIHPNGSVILFKGENYANDKELQWMKGLEVNGFLFEEINECQEAALDIAFARAGRWECAPRPKPIILATCNPTKGWVKSKIYDKWEAGTLPKTWLYIPAKITDNPHLTDEYKANLLNMPRYEYEVFVEGNWNISLKTGGEFWKQFSLDRHVSPVSYKPGPIHISLDENVNPYVTCTIWQVFGKAIHQVDEILSRSPENNAPKAAQKLVRWLLQKDHEDIVYVYGDPSAGKRSTIDENNASFYDKYIGTLRKAGFTVVNRVGRSAPQVALSAAFINSILETNLDGWSISIGEQCKTSIDDYVLVKESPDGTMHKPKVKDAKTGVTYESQGHISDSFRYFCVALLHAEFARYKSRSKKSGAVDVPG